MSNWEPVYRNEVRSVSTLASVTSDGRRNAAVEIGPSKQGLDGRQPEIWIAADQVDNEDELIESCTQRSGRRNVYNVSDQPSADVSGPWRCTSREEDSTAICVALLRSGPRNADVSAEPSKQGTTHMSELLFRLQRSTQTRFSTQRSGRCNSDDDLSPQSRRSLDYPSSGGDVTK